MSKPHNADYISTCSQHLFHHLLLPLFNKGHTSRVFVDEFWIPDEKVNERRREEEEQGQEERGSESEKE